MIILKGTPVTDNYLKGDDGRLLRGKVVETCPDADDYLVRVKFEGDKRSRWVKSGELILQ